MDEKISIKNKRERIEYGKLLFYFTNEDKPGKFEEVKMCKKLEELSKYKVEDLYDMFEEEFSGTPIDIHSILKKLGIECGAVDFSTIEGNFNNIVLPQQSAMVMGAVAAYSSNENKRDYVEISVNKNDHYHRQKFTLAHFGITLPIGCQPKQKTLAIPCQKQVFFVHSL